MLKIGGELINFSAWLNYNNLKKYYLEIICSALLIISIIYFVFTLSQIQGKKAHLRDYKSKLQLLKISNTKNESTKHKKNDYQATFETALKQSGFNILQIEKNINYVKALVEPNYEGRQKLLELLDNIQYTELNNTLEIVWVFDVPDKQHINKQENEMKLNAICFFDESSWQIWINGRMYDPQNKQIDDAIIEKVTDSSVIIKRYDKKIVLQLN